MCVIAVSPKGERQPTEKELYAMWVNNPHGGGYMSVRKNRVEIHKGFLYWEDFIRSVKAEKFTSADPVVYHFRISTQGGICEEMTHPFPITHQLSMMTALDVVCDVGVAHNGIIPLTTTKEETEYSDTALFVSKYLSWLVRSPSDILNPNIKTMIEELGESKFALLNCKGDISIIGRFFAHSGVLVSNEYYLNDYGFMAKGGLSRCIGW